MSDKTVGIARFRVALDDGATWSVSIKQRDQIEWEDYAAPKNWDQTKRPGRWSAYVAWRASRREGYVPKTMTWDQWFDALDYAVAEQDTEDAAPFPGGDDPSATDRAGGGDGVDPPAVA